MDGLNVPSNKCHYCTGDGYTIELSSFGHLKHPCTPCNGTGKIPVVQIKTLELVTDFPPNQIGGVEATLTVSEGGSIQYLKVVDPFKKQITVTQLRRTAKDIDDTVNGLTGFFISMDGSDNGLLDRHITEDARNLHNKLVKWANEVENGE
jgi:hypothetical protein